MSTPEARRIRLAVWLRLPLDDTMAALEALAASPRPATALAAMAVGLIVTWFVYVPVHELLHVAGCVLTGGQVSELELDPLYGGALLARFLPFVVPGGEYAGRLSGFDTGGSDGIYLATVFAPYLLSIAIGVPLLRLCARRARPLLVGAAAVLALAPFYNVVGDYYEMGSILVTRAASLGSGGAAPPHAGLRSDDLIQLVSRLGSEPQTLDLPEDSWIGVAWLLVGLGAALSVLLAFLSYGAGSVWADALLRRRR